MSMLDCIVLLYFAFGMAVMLLLFCGFDSYLGLLNHGKTMNKCCDSAILVSKKRFEDFYLLGFTVNVFIIMINPSALLLIFQLHLLRRLIETHFLMTYSITSNMHFIHYLVGLSFYPMISLVLIAESPKRLNLCGFGVFCILSFLQFQAHHILYNLRMASIEHQPLPRIHLFRLLLCPHYFLEILLYCWIQYQLSFSKTSTAAFFFVFTNIFISSIQTRTWYQLSFGPDSRYAIIPFLCWKQTHKIVLNL